MANYGLGLGAFTQGFAGGLGLGQKWQDTQRRNDQQKAIEGVNTEVKSAFDADVAAGKTTPDKYTDYWIQNALPKLTQTYIQNGNVEQAAALQKWGESDAARRGTAAFGRILTAGSFEDAGKAFTELATTKGYLPNGYVLAGSEAVPGANGQQGYKFTWRSPDGKSYSQQFGSIDELKTAAAGALNPEAMAKMHLDRANWAAEDQRRLGLYRSQKEIDAQPGLQPPPDGFRWNADRSGYEAIPGGPADVGYQGAKAQATQAPPAGFTRRPDGGGYIPVPGGPADPGYISAKTKAETEAKSGPQNNPYATGAYTEGQGKAATFADRMAQAHEIINQNENINSGWSGAAGAAVSSALGGRAPAVANAVSSEARQKVEQAQRNFINSVLRRESGAVISSDEFANARQQYFPQPGDTPEVIAQKRQNRESSIQGLFREAGPSYKPPKGWEDPTKPPQPTAKGQGAQTGGGTPTSSAPVMGAPKTTQAAPNDALAQAKAAIARGAPRDAVMKRLQQMGVDTAGI
jgi:hypothetical protein